MRPIWYMIGVVSSKKATRQRACELSGEAAPSKLLIVVPLFIASRRGLLTADQPLPRQGREHVGTKGAHRLHHYSHRVRRPSREKLDRRWLPVVAPPGRPRHWRRVHRRGAPT